MKLSRTLILPAVVILAACLASVGCGSGDGEQKAQSVIKIGIDGDFPPYTYKNTEGAITGLDIELATEVAKRMGDKTEFIPIKWSEKDSLLDQGRIDCIWSCYTMDGREEKYSWSKPYMKSGQYAVIRKDSDILDIADLNGKVIAAQATTKFLEAIKKGSIKAGKILEFDTAKECFDAVMSGKADATGGHLAVMLAEVKANADRSSLEVLTEQPLNTSRIGVAFKKGYSEKAVKLNSALDAMFRDGTTERIAAKYYLSKDVLIRE